MAASTKTFLLCALEVTRSWVKEVELKVPSNGEILDCTRSHLQGKGEKMHKFISKVFEPHMAMVDPMREMFDIRRLEGFLKGSSPWFCAFMVRNIPCFSKTFSTPRHILFNLLSLGEVPTAHYAIMQKRTKVLNRIQWIGLIWAAETQIVEQGICFLEFWIGYLDSMLPSMQQFHLLILILNVKGKTAIPYMLKMPFPCFVSDYAITGWFPQKLWMIMRISDKVKPAKWDEDSLAVERVIESALSQLKSACFCCSNLTIIHICSHQLNKLSRTWLFQLQDTRVTGLLCFAASQLIQTRQANNFLNHGSLDCSKHCIVTFASS